MDWANVEEEEGGGGDGEGLELSTRSMITGGTGASPCSRLTRPEGTRSLWPSSCRRRRGGGGGGDGVGGGGGELGKCHTASLQGNEFYFSLITIVA